MKIADNLFRSKKDGFQFFQGDDKRMSHNKITSENSFNSFERYADYDGKPKSTVAQQTPETAPGRTKDEDYTVKPGDTLSEIAARRGFTLDEILRRNIEIKNRDKIRVGQHIKLPIAADKIQIVNYTVKRGDTLSEIARQHHTTTRKIMLANPGVVRLPNFIYPGQHLRIPVKSDAPTSSPPPTQQPKQHPKQPTTQTPTAKQPSVIVDVNPPVATTQNQMTKSGNLKIARVNLDDFLSPQKSSNAGYAILIGNAEGNRKPDGGKTDHYYGHRDPGDGKWNIGSFSYSNERAGAQQAKSPEDADRIQLTKLYKNKDVYVAAMNKSGLDPNNALLATVYLDMYNQSPTSAQNLLKPENLKYLKENGINIETMKEWRFRGFVNAETGQRWRYANGSLAGGNEKSGLAKIAHQNAQRKHNRSATEAEIQDLVRHDQNRRVSEMIEPMKNVGLLSIEKSPDANAPQTRKTASSASTTPTVAAGEKAVSTGYYHVRSGVVLSENAKAKLSQIGQAYQQKTGKTMQITSGTRTPYKQAGAMFTKIQLGDSFSEYKNRAALSEILSAYKQAKTAGKSSEQAKQAMAQTIQNQVDRGVYISRHLRGGAADVSIIGLNQSAFREAVKSVTGQEPLYEGKPPHFHLQF